MDLFENSESNSHTINAPLASKLRPASLEEFVGQSHLTDVSSPFRKAIDEGNLGSVIFWGPPGCGKTTLARIVARNSDSFLVEMSAVTCGVKEIRETAIQAQQRSKQTILFLDEIHHFSRTQQDSLLGIVEEGTIILMGATTENPTFSLGVPLLSRCKVIVLKPLSNDETDFVIRRAIQALNLEIELDAIEQLNLWANGDARIAINTIEFAAQLAYPSNLITAKNVADVLNKPLLRYDQGGDQHYDVISAFIKSVRGSDVDAALHYLARMIVAGEDPRFIARRLLILASEDVGNAAPNSLLLANAAFHAVEKIGMPESRIILAQVTIFLAASPKSNSAYIAIDNAIKDIKRVPAPKIPDHLRDPNSKRFDNSDNNSAYQYPHDFGGWINQNYLSDNHGLGLPYFEGIPNGYEAKLIQFLSETKK